MVTMMNMTMIVMVVVDAQRRWMLRVFGVNDPARVVPLDPHQPYIVRA